VGESTTRWSAASVARASGHAHVRLGRGVAGGKTGHSVLVVHALCLTHVAGLVLLVGAGARQGYTLLHFDVAWRVGAGTRVVQGGGGRGEGGGGTGSEERRWTRSICIRHGRLHESLSPIPPSPTRAHLPDVSV